MKTLLLASAFALCAVSAQAQTANSNSTSTSTSHSQAAAVALAKGGRGGNISNNSVSVGAPGLAASGACLGSVSAGVGAGGFGLSFGTTKQDDPCNRRENARVMGALGYKDVAVRIMLEDPQVARAMQAYSTTYYRAAPAQRPAGYPQPPRYTEERAFMSASVTPARRAAGQCQIVSTYNPNLCLD